MPSPQQSLTPGAAESMAPPRELADLALAQPPAGGATVASAKEPASPALSSTAPQLPQFMSLVHSYLLSMITLADQKSAFVFTADSAFLGYLLAAGLLHQLQAPPSSWAVRQWCGAMALAFLVCSIAAIINVVMPRLGGKARGLIYFKAIAARKGSQQYAMEVLSSADPSLSVALAEHSYEVARISTRKYRSLQFGIWVGILGFLAGFIFVGLGR
jgi:hypothetical protein